ncbi:winged helix DNA-binding domain-containing protein [Pseudokineococcus sp. 1T1Z-3]|uniref:winged helix DNA-binding domain-containing protein n=1 Tax=Pseudokineococcus sp. 1T1Z-3 TaxID=3132745 RepID=UPI0030B63D95
MTAVQVSAKEVSLLRLAAQRLAGPPEAGPVDVVRHLLALQGQDLRGALVATALRAGLAGTGALDVVRDAMAAGEVVRSWPMRGTLHLVPAEDLGWLLALTAERTLRGAAARRRELGLDDATLDRGRQVLVGALEGGRALTREAAVAALTEAGVLDGPGGRAYHLLFSLAQTGDVCWGPPVDAPADLPSTTRASDDQRLVLLAEWVPRPRTLEREEALGELALRYLRSHGPASVADLARWCGLPLGEVRTGVALARPALEVVGCDGVELLLDPATPERLAAARAHARRPRLLPGFDEMVLGYADRTATLSREDERLVVPGGNGVFAPTVVAGGQAVGTWRRSTRRTGPPVVATPFRTFTAAVERALPALAEALPR